MIKVSIAAVMDVSRALEKGVAIGARNDSIIEAAIEMSSALGMEVTKEANVIEILMVPGETAS
jgi:phage-related minor tail protein